VPRTVQQIQDRLCTVGRTVTLGDPVRYVAGSITDPIVAHGEELSTRDEDFARTPEPHGD
jgi:hypothetical protein